MTSTARLAHVLARLERDVRDLQLAPRLGYSSFDGTITGYDPTGQPTVQIGTQFDGTNGAYPLSGPKPPRPSRPGLLPVPGGLTVVWDGYCALDPTTGEIPFIPMDFSRVEVHVMSHPSHYNGGAGTLVGTIESPRGGQITVTPLAIETKYALLVMRSLPGRASDPSEVAVGVPGSVVSDEELADINATLAEIGQSADRKGRVYHQDTPPESGTVYDTWFNTAEGGAIYRWDVDTSRWVKVPLGTEAIDVGAITSDLLAINAVQEGNLGPGAVTTDKIAPTAIHEEHLADNAVTNGKVAPSAIRAEQLADNAVTNGKVAPAAIHEEQLAANAVTNGKVAPSAIHEEQLADNAVTSGKVVDGGISTAKIAEGAVTRERLGPKAVGTLNLDDFAVTVTKFKSNKHFIF